MTLVQFLHIFHAKIVTNAHIITVIIVTFQFCMYNYAENRIPYTHTIRRDITAYRYNIPTDSEILFR